MVPEEHEEMRRWPVREGWERGGAVLLNARGGRMSDGDLGVCVALRRN